MLGDRGQPLHENVGSVQRSLPRPRLARPRTDQHRNRFPRASRNLQHLGIEQDFDPLILHEFQKTGGNIGVFFLKQTHAVLNDRDAAPETAHRLGEFQPDVTSSEDDEMLRKALQVQGFDVRHRPGLGKPRNAGKPRPSAYVDKDAIALKLACSTGVQCHLDRFRLCKRRFTHHQFCTARFELGEMHLHQPIDHLPLAARDGGHIDAHISGHDAQTSLGINERNGLRTLNNVLARQAGHIRARAANHRPFDDDRLLALARQRPAKKFTGDPAPDDEILNVLSAFMRDRSFF